MRRRLTGVLLSVFLVLSAGFACGQEQNLLPKYGSEPKSDALKAADAVFIAEMDKEYRGDRVKASADIATRGWQYVSQGDFDGAMRRFNQAWLLDAKNGTALWGMAAVETSAGNFDESLKLFVEAEKYVGDNLNFSVDFAKALGVAGATLKDDSLLKMAYNRFQVNYKKAPENTNNLQNWAITLFGVGEYSDAWAKVKLAEVTPDKGQLDPQFIAALQAKMPRP